MEDQQIVDLFLRREESAIAQTKELYGARLRQLSLGIVQDPETAEECENDTYLQAWQTIPPHEPRNYLFAFLARIIRHISIDRSRYQQRLCRSAYVQELSLELLACVPSGHDPAEQLNAKALGQAISDFLRTLPQESRILFIRRYWYMDSIEELSHRFSMTQSKVKSRLFRSRNALRKYLEKEGFAV
jgi:RNA polymerase sigma-70 factor (ECF subfamily)